MQDYVATQVLYTQGYVATQVLYTQDYFATQVFFSCEVFFLLLFGTKCCEILKKLLILYHIHIL